MSNDGNMDDAFGLGPKPEEPKRALIEQFNNSDSKLQNDYEYARRNMQALLETGANALEELANVARQSQNARTYEVLAGLIKTLSDTNKDLLNLTGIRREIEPNTVSTTNQTINSVNNALFIGSTADLHKMLKKVQSGEFFKSDDDRPIIDGETD